MNWDTLQDGLVITLNVSAMLAMGLALSLARLGAAFRRTRVIGVGLALNLLAAPLLAWAITRGLGIQAAFALGFMLVAVAPGGNTGPLLTANARGDIAYSVALVVILSFASVLTVPALMGALASGNAEGRMGGQATLMIKMILTYQIAPLCAGMAVHAIHEGFAARLAPVARALGNFCLLALTIGLLLLKGDVILDAGVATLLAIEGFVLLALASGLLLGSVRDPTARALALTTSTRNLSLGMLLGSQVFRSEPAVMLGVLTYGLLWISTALPVSFWLRRYSVGP